MTGLGAVLIVDVQNSFAHPDHTPWLPPADRERIEAAADRCVELVDMARRTGTEVVWVRLVQTRDRPWRAARRLRGVADDAPWPGDEPCVAGTEGVGWYRVTPRADEQVIDKRYYSGFLDTTLDSVLTDRGIGRVAVAGLTTECCILATVYDAVQHGYRAVLVTDATAAYSEDDHVAAVRMMLANAAGATTVDALFAKAGAR